MQGLSAIAKVMLYCTQAFYFASMAICELQPRLQFREPWSSWQSMRQTLIQGRGCAFIGRFQRPWYRSQDYCRAGLQTRAILSTC